MNIPVKNRMESEDGFGPALIEYPTPSPIPVARDVRRFAFNILYFVFLERRIPDRRTAMEGGSDTRIMAHSPADEGASACPMTEFSIP